MKTKTINQEVHFKASPEDVYDMIMDSKKHTALSGAAAKIDPKVGGKFTAHGGYIKGENLELIPGKKIVQSWNAQEENWPDDYYSKITFVLKPERGGTTLKFKHEGVPVEHADSIEEGWISYYWEPMGKLAN